MLPNTYFENNLFQKYLILFGRMFNNIRIERSREPGDEKTQHQIVPIAHGGREKYVARNTTDPNIERIVAAQLPRMAFEMVDFFPDPKRQLNTIGQNCFMPTPYSFVFNLYITARNVLDAAKIVEQIAPFFRPSIGIRADLLDNDVPYDLKLTLSNPDMKDNYEGQMTDRRVLVWTLTFTLDAWLFGPQTTSGGVIKWVTVNSIDGGNGKLLAKSNTYPVLAGTELEDIQPSDPFIIRTDYTEFFE
jgi:hypothetical protein